MREPKTNPPKASARKTPPVVVPADEAEPQAKPERASGGVPSTVGFVIWLVVTAVFIAVAIGFVTLAAPKFKAKPLTGSVTATEDRVRALEQKLTAYDQAGGAASLVEVQGLKAAFALLKPQNPDGAASLEARVLMLESAVQEIKARADSLDALEKRLASLEASVQAPLAGPALILALDTLENATLQSHPFSAQLMAVKQLNSDLQGLSALAPYAAIGVPTRAALVAEFPALAAKSFEMSRQPAEGANLFDKILYTLTRFVSVRRTGLAPGDGVDSILARAEHRVREGDLAAALDETGDLTGAAADVMKDWREAAEARLAVESAMVQVKAAAVASVLRVQPETAAATPTAEVQ